MGVQRIQSDWSTPGNMREHETETMTVIHKEKLLFENKRKTKPTHLSDARQNEGELWVRQNTVRERTGSENELRGCKERRNQSRPICRSSRNNMKSRSSRESQKRSHVDVTQCILNFIKEERVKDIKERQKRKRKRKNS